MASLSKEHCFLLLSMIIITVGYSPFAFGESGPVGGKDLPIIEGLGFNVGRLDSSLIPTPRLRLFYSKEEVALARVRIHKNSKAKNTLSCLIDQAEP